MKNKQFKTPIATALLVISVMISVGCTSEYVENNSNISTSQLNIHIDTNNNLNDNTNFNISLFPLNSEYSNRIEYIIATNEYITIPKGTYNILIYATEISNITNTCITLYASCTNIEIRQNDNRLTFKTKTIEKKRIFDWLYNEPGQNKRVITLSENGVLSESVINIDVEDWEDNQDSDVEFSSYTDPCQG